MNSYTLLLPFKIIYILILTIADGLYQWLIPCSWCQKDVSNDIILITGAGSGLGREIAIRYAKLGSSLVLWDIDKSGMADTKSLVEDEYSKKYGDAAMRKFCLTYIVDVSDKNQVKQFAEKVYADLNQGKRDNESYVTVLVNNAGIYHGLLLKDLTDAQIERIFAINVLAHFWTVRAFLPKMIEHEKGHIVEIASIAGLAGLVKQVDYCSTKFATVGFEESLSIELACLGMKDKVRTTVVCPYFFNSNLLSGFDNSITKLMSSEYVAKETVKAMRCNYSRILVPKLYYITTIFKPFATRDALIRFVKAIGAVDSLREIKGGRCGIIEDFQSSMTEFWEANLFGLEEEKQAKYTTKNGTLDHEFHNENPWVPPEAIANIIGNIDNYEVELLSQNSNLNIINKQMRSVGFVGLAVLGYQIGRSRQPSLVTLACNRKIYVIDTNDNRSIEFLRRKLNDTDIEFWIVNGLEESDSLYAWFNINFSSTVQSCMAVHMQIIESLKSVPRNFRFALYPYNAAVESLKKNLRFQPSKRLLETWLDIEEEDLIDYDIPYTHHNDSRPLNISTRNIILINSVLIIPLALKLKEALQIELRASMTETFERFQIDDSNVTNIMEKYTSILDERGEINPSYFAYLENGVTDGLHSKLNSDFD